MPKYTDDDIRQMKKITCKIAGDYLGISSMAVSIGMRNNLLPIGFAIHNEERDRRYSESWSYHIIGERLIAYKYGKTSEVQVQNIEKSLNVIIEQFESMKKDRVFLLSENDSCGTNNSSNPVEVVDEILAVNNSSNAVARIIYFRSFKLLGLTSRFTYLSLTHKNIKPESSKHLWNIKNTEKK